MRVLLTTDTIGGVWTFTKELTTELLRRGHAVALVSFGRAPSADQQAWADSISSNRVTNSNRFQYHASELPLEWMQDNAAAFTAAIPLLLNLVRTFAPDLLHANQFCFGALPARLPRLVTAHSDVLTWAAACKPSALSPSPWLAQYKSLVATGLAQADALICPTHAYAAAFATTWSTAPPLQVILNGRTLPTAIHAPRNLQAVTAGRLWDEAKNLALLHQVASPLPILIAGETEPAATPHATPQAPLKPLGPLPEASLLTLFAQSALYLAPSLYEPFGLAPLEAALSGCALLLNDIPTFREIWGPAALYFKDAPTLTRQLESLKLNPAALSQAQAAATRRAHHLTAARTANHYEALYHHLLASQQKYA